MVSFRVRNRCVWCMLPVLLLVTIADTLLLNNAARAQTCGTEYKIKEGETLAQIAARVYGNPTQWTVIFYANQDRLGTNASLLVPGLAIMLPCVGGASPPSPSQPQNATAPAQQPPATSADSPIMISTMVRRVELLTADGYPPFTGRALEGGGMLTEVISSAMNIVKQEAKGRFDFGISWVNDWSAHLNPLLLTRAFDVGFPWARPDCDSAAALDASSQFRCRRFFFSDPLYEVTTSLFVRTGSAITSLQSEKISGVTFCLPAGQGAYELDQGGRNWVKDGKVTLMRPPTVDDCFRLLDNGTVEGVVATEYSGRATVISLGLADKVRMLDQPIALTPLHVVISKSHPHARTILYYMNTALAKLRDSGDYDAIIERHLDRFWEAQQATSAPSPAIGLTPATQPKGARPAAQSGNTPAPEVASPASAPKPTPKTETKLAR